MENKFKLTQLFRTGNNSVGGSIEIRPEEKVDCKIQMSEESKEGLWMFVDDDWDNEKIATVIFDGFYPDGFTPINPIITHIEYKKP